MQIFFPTLVGKLVSRFGIRPGPASEPMNLADLTPITDMDALALVPSGGRDATVDLIAAGAVAAFTVPAGERWGLQAIGGLQLDGTFDWHLVLFRSVDIGGPDNWVPLSDSVASGTALKALSWSPPLTLFPGDKVGIEATGWSVDGDVDVNWAHVVLDCAS